jgi:hypothetical protein
MLADALNNFKQARDSAVRRCVVGDWSTTLSEEDQGLLVEALADYTISNRQLLKILHNAGASYSLEAIRKHRNQECPCLV